MDSPIWPTTTDLLGFVRGAGITPTPEQTVVIARHLMGAIAQWERQTNWRPFLAAADPTTRYFDPPLNGFVDFKGGLCRLDSLAVSGTGYTINQQFFLKPDNADQEGKPWTGAIFGSIGGFLPYDHTNNYLFLTGSGRRSIAITGLWGYRATVPGDAWEAVAARVMKTILPIFGARRSRGLLRWHAADAEEEYGQTPYQQAIDMAAADWDELAASYRRQWVA